jgi:NitT/TauT family transport system ATP-binding protein
MMRVVFEGVGKNFGATPAVRDVDFVLEPGSLGVIVGPSGCGKSTLLSLAAGLDRASSGRVVIGGRTVSGITGGQVALIFQNHSLFDWATVLDNVAFGLRMRGMPRHAARSRARALLADVGLERCAGLVPAELSGGMRQRVALARVLVLDPAVILLDEPFAALDHQTRRMMQSYLLDTSRRTGATILLVTHDLTEAVRLADRLVLFSGAPGTVRDIIDIDAAQPRDLSHPVLARLLRELEEHLRSAVMLQEFTPEERLRVLTD